MQRIHKRKAPVGQMEGDRFTPLMLASAMGDDSAVDKLLRAGANAIAIEPRMGLTALHLAAQSGGREVIDLLLDHGAFIDQQTPTLGHTALLDAVLYRHEAAVRALLVRGANTAIRTHYGMTALDHARGDRLTPLIQLIEAEEQRRALAATAQKLMAAIKANDVAAVRGLLAAGAPVDGRTLAMGTLDDDYTPLGLAARDGQVEIVAVLLDAGADIRQLNGPMRATAGHEAGYMGNADVARLLTRHCSGARALDINAQGDYNGYTALHDAVWRGHLETAQVLIEAGADPSLKSHAGQTAYQLARRHGHEDLARLLRDIARPSRDETGPSGA